eukprot:1321661-Prymnesium_polylepis.1
MGVRPVLLLARAARDDVAQQRRQQRLRRHHERPPAAGAHSDSYELGHVHSARALGRVRVADGRCCRQRRCQATTRAP